ncbi:GH32 C-terminal domain-containing protein [Lactobacillus sp. DCY120]|uniref:beta-fructofuranosidase n=1 Tax=Bombilactobacillus apium TaxID=2675299 RepID=A0A850QXA2_9LACO|nr:GH32 C-terminal domain-containing protein [Bombilactobacillus apium]NVY96444.1 GH32 C-terminal domain-containing protein [Bombilactobacillus apium]
MLTNENMIPFPGSSYHVKSMRGIFNSPNGFCYYEGYYHLFYQYRLLPGDLHQLVWGHLRSRDLVYWQTVPIDLPVKNQSFTGQYFAGSVLIKKDVLYLIYTSTQQNSNYSLTYNQNIAFSRDAVTFTPDYHNPVLSSADQLHWRKLSNPQIWEHDGKYFLLLKGVDDHQQQQALIYTANNLHHWLYLGAILPLPLKAKAQVEYLNLLHLNGKDILLVSYLGAKDQHGQHHTQSYYCYGNLNYQQVSFQKPEWQRLDFGHNSGITQTLLAPDGRYLIMGWLDNDPTSNQACETTRSLMLPRELTFEEGHLFMHPIAELQDLRQELLQDCQLIPQKQQIILQNQLNFELNLNLDLSTWSGQELTLDWLDAHDQVLLQLQYRRDQKRLVLHRHDSTSDAPATLKDSASLKLQIFGDQNSLEIFVNDGYLTFSESYHFLTPPQIRFSCDQPLKTHCQAYQLETLP